MSATYLIVVGVDGSEGGRRALDWAAREAAARGGAVQAVIAWSWDGIEYGPVAATSPREEAERAGAVLDREIKALIERRGSDLPVAGEVIEGRPSDVLSAAGRSADLLVLGSHGHSRVRHTVLGSVSEDCVRKAACPVVVIPVPAEHPRNAADPVLRH
ncbi:universal stress protein [Actinoplanes sp. NBRC 14428]|uniref:Nucleotide-binding universal stress UspA family protein n=1 Tax=Pseudosporangium ferrugineum TaxID=439699 RepID=A0A2T0SHS6_9ACTN|nr:universal stress protein [Pseudosporangium ferrugineum]PRY32968.1 nucleotide-binding universal stress UspA family protein [Pseudosporangium ferrugineum]BCJ49065.1 universal stress protein [Actinoplanes sp. NBRC 14428]